MYTHRPKTQVLTKFYETEARALRTACALLGIPIGAFIRAAVMTRLKPMLVNYPDLLESAQSLGEPYPLLESWVKESAAIPKGGFNKD